MDHTEDCPHSMVPVCGCWHRLRQQNEELVKGLKEAIETIHGEFCGSQCHCAHLELLPYLQSVEAKS